MRFVLIGHVAERKKGPQGLNQYGPHFLFDRSSKGIRAFLCQHFHHISDRDSFSDVARSPFTAKKKKTTTTTLAVVIGLFLGGKWE